MSEPLNETFNPVFKRVQLDHGKTNVQSVKKHFILFITNRFLFDNTRRINVEAALCDILIPESALHLNPTLQHLASGLILIQ